MRLYAYLSRNGISVENFAAEIQVASLSTIYRYMRGERIPCARTMERIREVTDGAVTADDFFRSRQWWESRRQTVEPKTHSNVWA